MEIAKSEGPSSSPLHLCPSKRKKEKEKRKPSPEDCNSGIIKSMESKGKKQMRKLNICVKLIWKA